MQTIRDGQHIDRYIPKDLRGMFYRNPNSQFRYAQHNGYDPYGFKTDGLVAYVPLWALKGNGFPSVDAYKHACTITGASWLPDGRSFDGVDDFVAISTLTTDLSSADFSVMAWIKAVSETVSSYAVSQSHVAEPYASDWILGGSSLADEAFWMRSVAVNYDVGHDCRLWHLVGCVWNVVAETYDVFVDGANIGTSGVVAGYGGVGSVKMGTRGDATTSFYAGSTGESWIYDKCLSDSEVLNLYNQTQWRYQ